MKHTKRLWACALLAACLALTGCSQSSVQAYVQPTPEGAVAIPALPDASADDTLNATLYFRYEDTALLRQEMRVISVSPNKTRESALVEALLAGSQEGGGSLFPEGVELLSTQTQDGVVFVTFNEALYGRYGDESGSLTAAHALPEAQLRRHLAMAALTAALTENGQCHAVQVLVRQQSAIGSSMRLKESYFLENSEQPAALLTRNEDYLMTPANVAHFLLRAWQQRNFDTMYPLLTNLDGASARPAQTTASEMLAATDALLVYSLSPGSISPDGQSAVVCIDMTLRHADGSEYRLEAWPLKLTRENGAFKVSLSALKSLMQLNEE